MKKKSIVPFAIFLTVSAFTMGIAAGILIMNEKSVGLTWFALTIGVPAFGCAAVSLWAMFENWK